MAEESKQSGLTNDLSKDDRSIGSLSLEDNYSDLEESLDFDIYIDDIPLIAEANSDFPQNEDSKSSKNVVHFTDPSSDSPGPIPLNLSSFNEEDTNDYPELETKVFSEDDLDDILLKDESSSNFEDDGPIALSSDELNNITDSDYSTDDEYSPSSSGNTSFTNDSFDSNELNDTYDTDLGDDEDITLGSDELDKILNPDEDDEPETENDFETKSFFDSETEDDEPIALSTDELNNITDSDYSDTADFETDDFISDPPTNLFEDTESEEGDIALSGDELNNLLESGNAEEHEDDFEDGEAKSFFDSEPEEDDESIALSPDELNNITDSEYQVEDGIETDDLSSGIESNEYGVSTDNIFGEESDQEDEDISLSGDELNNILETGEIEVEGDTYDEPAEENAKSFFDSEEEDDSIALSPDELGNITAEQDFNSEDVESTENGDNFDLSEATEDLEMESAPSLFEENTVEDEEIALSGDELNNLLESGEIETEEADSLGSSLFETNSEEDESIALSPDELGNITAEEDFELDSVDSAEDSVLQEDNFDLPESNDDFEMEQSSHLFDEDSSDEDGEIALSGDELNNLLESGEVAAEEAEHTMGSSLFEENVEEDDSIALSPDELGNITAEEDFELDSIDSVEDSVLPEDNFNLPESDEDFNFDTPTNLFGESTDSTDEEIALSGDELDNILQSGEVEREEADDFTNPIDSGMVIGDDDFEIDDNSSLANLGEFNLEESSPEDLSDSTDRFDSFQFGSVKKEELKKVISYMDELLGSLPDSYIKEFASSEYFELYKKIMNELEL